MEQDVAESEATNAKLGKDIEGKEKEVMSLNELLKQEKLSIIAHEKNYYETAPGNQFLERICMSWWIIKGNIGKR